MVGASWVRTVSGTIDVAPQRTQRFIVPLFSITLSRFHAWRDRMFPPSCAFQLSSTHAATPGGGSDQSHAVDPPAPAPPALDPDPPLPAAPAVPAAPALPVPPAPPAPPAAPPALGAPPPPSAAAAPPASAAPLPLFPALEIDTVPPLLTALPPMPAPPEPVEVPPVDKLPEAPETAPAPTLLGSDEAGSPPQAELSARSQAPCHARETFSIDSISAASRALAVAGSSHRAVGDAPSLEWVNNRGRGARESPHPSTSCLDCARAHHLEPPLESAER